MFAMSHGNERARDQWSGGERPASLTTYSSNIFSTEASGPGGSEPLDCRLTGRRTGGEYVTERRGGRCGAWRVSVGEAAVLLGISKDAVMTRIRHGTLRSGKTDDQMVHVWLGEDLASDRNTVHPRPRVEASPRGTAEDIEELREQVHQLREILAEERGVGGREDRIIAQLTQANASLAPLVPELETPAPPIRPEPVKPAEAKTSQPHRAEPERKGPGKEAGIGAGSARSRRRESPPSDGGGSSVAEGGEVGANS